MKSRILFIVLVFFSLSLYAQSSETAENQNPSVETSEEALNMLEAMGETEEERSFASSKQNTDGIGLSLGGSFEGNGYTTEGLVPAFGFSIGKDIFEKMGIGFKMNFTTNTSIEYDDGSTSDAHTIEILGAGRYYLFSPSGNTHSGLFGEADVGCAVISIKESDETKTAFVLGAAAGWKFSGKHLYCEPYVRLGYPFMFGLGISAGLKF